MTTVFPCYSSQDKPFASELASFLERGANVRVFLEDGEIGAGETLVSKAADGLQAEVILLILSPDSCPRLLKRPEWEPAMRDEPKKAGVKVGTILAGNCAFPEVLRREAFFDVTLDRLAGLRKIKCWLLGLQTRSELDFESARPACFHNRVAELETLWQALADAPGAAVLTGTGKTTLALEFARQSAQEFEGTVWLSCAGESLAALAGEMGAQLGMTLPGDEEANLRHVLSFCGQRRLLVVLDDAPEGAARLIAGGRSSTLLTTSGAGPAGCARLVLQDLTPPSDPADLDLRHTHLLAAASACSGAPFRPWLVAELACVDQPVASELLGDLTNRGVAIQLDARFYSIPPGKPSGAQSRAHAQALARHFASWAQPESQCAADLPQLRLALRWALSQDEEDGEAWQQACELARRGVALLKQNSRQAEAFELLEAVADAAELREDRRMLEDCTRDQYWILLSWDRTEEAQAILDKRRALYEDQLHLNFE